MPIKIRAADARNNFAELLGRAHFGRETFLIEKQGEPFAVIMGIEEYLRLLGEYPEVFDGSGDTSDLARRGPIPSGHPRDSMEHHPGTPSENDEPRAELGSDGAE